MKSSREIDAVFREAQKAIHPLVILLVAQTPEGRGPGGRVAFIAGKKLGGAVLRNRSRRVLREAVLRAGGPWPDCDAVFVARAETSEASAAALDDALAITLKRAGIR